MRMMSDMQERVLQELVKVARGNPLLVEEALRAVSKKPKSTFADLVAYIRAHREEHTKAA